MKQTPLDIQMLIPPAQRRQMGKEATENIGEAYRQLPKYASLGKSVPDGGDMVAFLHWFGPGAIDFYAIARHSTENEGAFDLKTIGSWGQGEWEESWWYMGDASFWDDFPDYIELDNHFDPRPLNSIKSGINGFNPYWEEIPPEEVLSSDGWFRLHPNRVLGARSWKARSDRGEGKYEEIIKNTLTAALAGIDAPKAARANAVNVASSKEAERLRLLAVSMQMELEMIEIELELQ